jgi:hypothetical protein
MMKKFQSSFKGRRGDAAIDPEDIKVVKQLRKDWIGKERTILSDMDSIFPAMKRLQNAMAGKRFRRRSEEPAQTRSLITSLQGHRRMPRA